MLAMSTQHCIGGFSWCNKARKQERKKKSLDCKETKLSSFTDDHVIESVKNYQK